MELICKGNIVSPQAGLIAFLKREKDCHLGLIGRPCLAQSQPFPSVDGCERIQDIDTTFNKMATNSQTCKNGENGWFKLKYIRILNKCHVEIKRQKSKNLNICKFDFHNS